MPTSKRPLVLGVLLAATVLGLAGPATAQSPAELEPWVRLTLDSGGRATGLLVQVNEDHLLLMDRRERIRTVSLVDIQRTEFRTSRRKGSGGAFTLVVGGSALLFGALAAMPGASDPDAWFELTPVGGAMIGAVFALPFGILASQMHYSRWADTELSEVTEGLARPSAANLRLRTAPAPDGGFAVALSLTLGR